MGVNGEALQLHAVYREPCFFFYYKSCKNPYQLQVMRESVSVLQVMCAAAECAMKSKVDKILSTVVPSYTRKKYHSFVAVGIVTRAVHS